MFGAHGDMGGMRARTRWRLGAEHGIAFAQPGHTPTDRAHRPDKIVTEHERHARRAHEREEPAAIAVAAAHIDGIDRSCLHLHHDLALAWLRAGRRAQPQREGIAKAVDGGDIAVTHDATTRLRCWPRSMAPSSVRIEAVMMSPGRR